MLSQALGEESVLLDLSSERYYALNEVGTRIWALIGEGNDLAGVWTTLLAEYEAEPDELRSDLDRIVNELLAADLIQAVDA